MPEYATRQELSQELAAQEERIVNRLAELIRDAQTEILRGFAAFQKGYMVQMRRLRADQRNLDTEVAQRMEAVENRLAEIEQRLGIQLPPPPQA